METVGFLMMAHKTTPEELARQARIMVDAGAQCVYVVDSAGALVLDTAQDAGRGDRARDRRRRPRSASTGTRTCRMGVANSVLAYQNGARQIDGALCALGAGAGNSPTEVLAATFDRLDIGTGVDVGGVLAAAEDVVSRSYRAGRRWTATRSCRVGRASTPRSCCTPSAPRERYGVPAARDPAPVGELGYVGGQEDMIIDVAIELATSKTKRK